MQALQTEKAGHCLYGSVIWSRLAAVQRVMGIGRYLSQAQLEFHRSDRGRRLASSACLDSKSMCCPYIPGYRQSGSIASLARTTDCGANGRLLGMAGLSRSPVFGVSYRSMRKPSAFHGPEADWVGAFFGKLTAASRSRCSANPRHGAFCGAWASACLNRVTAFGVT